MNKKVIRAVCAAVVLSTIFAVAQPVLLAGPAPAAQAAANFNLFKDVSAKKDVIVWKAAPSNALPNDVCNILSVCSGPIKLIAMPPATEKGQKVGREMFKAQDTKK